MGVDPAPPQSRAFRPGVDSASFIAGYLAAFLDATGLTPEQIMLCKRHNLQDGTIYMWYEAKPGEVARPPEAIPVDDPHLDRP